MGEEWTSIRRVEEHSETIDLYPDLAFLKREAAARDRTDFAIRPTLGRRQVSSFDVDPIFLGLVMRFRRGCMDGAAYSPDGFLVDHIVDLQSDIQPVSPRRARIEKAYASQGLRICRGAPCRTADTSVALPISAISAAIISAANSRRQPGSPLGSTFSMEESREPSSWC